MHLIYAHSKYHFLHNILIEVKKLFEAFKNLSPVWQTLIATLFTWGVTALGASIVFFFKKVNKTVMDAMLGFSAGVMIAASFFSLIEPALEMTKSLKMNGPVIISIGFLLGGTLLFIGDKIYNLVDKKKDGDKSSRKRCFMLISSITIHNIPEGLAVGVAFGSLAYNITGTTLLSAITIALGIGLQNFPEGSAVSLPLRREGYSRKKAFFYGQLSGIVEPISAVIGTILVLKIKTILPFLLAFAAGSMIYVVVEELIPESQTNPKKDLMAFFTLFGFVLMMILDITLG